MSLQEDEEVLPANVMLQQHIKSEGILHEEVTDYLQLSVSHDEHVSSLEEVSSEAVPGAECDTSRNIIIWSDGQTRYLLQLYKLNMDNIGPLKKYKTKRKMWVDVAINLSRRYKKQFTAQQVENKYKHCLKITKNAISNNRTKGARIPYPFESDMAEIITMDDSISIMPDLMVSSDLKKRKVPTPSGSTNSMMHVKYDEVAEYHQLRVSSLEEVSIETVPDAECDTSRNIIIWSDSQTRYLLQLIRLNIDNIGPSKKYKTKKEMWVELANNLSIRYGMQFTAQQVENKYKHCLKLTKTAISNNHTSGAVRIPDPFESDISEMVTMDDYIIPELMVSAEIKKVKEPTPLDSTNSIVHVKHEDVADYHELSFSNHGNVSSLEEVSSEADLSASSRNIIIWSDGQTKYLLQLYGLNIDNIGPLKKYKTKKEMWIDFANNLSMRYGTQFSAQQVENKYKHCLKLTKTAISNNNHASDAVRTLDPFDGDMAGTEAMEVIPEVILSPGIKKRKVPTPLGSSSSSTHSVEDEQQKPCCSSSCKSPEESKLKKISGHEKAMAKYIEMKMTLDANKQRRHEERMKMIEERTKLKKERFEYLKSKLDEINKTKTVKN